MWLRLEYWNEGSCEPVATNIISVQMEKVDYLWDEIAEFRKTRMFPGVELHGQPEH